MKSSIFEDYFSIKYKTINNLAPEIFHLKRGLLEKHVYEYDYLFDNLNLVDQVDYRNSYMKFWDMTGKELTHEYLNEYFKKLSLGIANGKKYKVNELLMFFVTIEDLVVMGSMEFSFATKLVHMLDNKLPIFDSHIKEFYGLMRPPTLLNPYDRIDLFYNHVYNFLNKEIERIIHLGLLDKAIKEFEKQFFPKRFSKEKIIDSLIWCFPL